MREREPEKTSLLSLALCSGDGRWTTFGFPFISIPMYVFSKAYLASQTIKNKREKNGPRTKHVARCDDQLTMEKYFAEARAGSKGLDESLTEPDFGNHSIVFNEVCFPSRVNLFY